MPDNWSFVAAAYGLTALVLGLYWRRLARKEKALTEQLMKTGPPRTVAVTTTSVAGTTRSVAGTSSSVAGTSGSVAGTSGSVEGTPSSVAERSRQPSGTGHPRPKPDSKQSLQ